MFLKDKRVNPWLWKWITPYVHQGERQVFTLPLNFPHQFSASCLELNPSGRNKRFEPRNLLRCWSARSVKMAAAALPPTAEKNSWHVIFLVDVSALLFQHSVLEAGSSCVRSPRHAAANWSGRHRPLPVSAALPEPCTTSPPPPAGTEVKLTLMTGTTSPKTVGQPVAEVRTPAASTSFCTKLLPSTPRWATTTRLTLNRKCCHGVSRLAYITIR